MMAFVMGILYAAMIGAGRVAGRYCKVAKHLIFGVAAAVNVYLFRQIPFTLVNAAVALIGIMTGVLLCNAIMMVHEYLRS